MLFRSVYPNIDLWLRTPERDEAEVAKNLSKRDVLIDDNKLEQDRTDTQNRRKMGMTDADRAATAGSVVYEAEGTDAEAVAAPRLMDDSKVKSKKPAASAAFVQQRFVVLFIFVIFRGKNG